jgi:hypothetical protein
MTIRNICTALAMAAIASLMTAAEARAHCDSLDGPVVKAAQRALDTRRLAEALIWVQPADEAEIRAAFDRTLAVRGLGPDARELADRYFFETLVRVHRAGEGAPYTGLKPAGQDLGPAIPAADNALEERSAAPVLALLTRTLEQQVRSQLQHVIKARNFKADDVAAGREFVRAYVEFIHYVERLHEAIVSSPHGHFAVEARGSKRD